VAVFRRLTLPALTLFVVFVQRVVGLDLILPGARR